jgi:membrane associated rhomboid family serine protease
MSQEPIYTAHPIEEERIHPLEEVMRLIGREAPRPFFPAEYLERSRVNPEHLSAVLDHLALEGLVSKVPARSMESGSGVVLTRLGEQVLADPALMSRLIRGDALREGDVGAVIRKGMRTRVKPYATYALIAANVLIYLLGMMNPAWAPPDVGVDRQTGKVVQRAAGERYKAWQGDAAAIRKGEWWRLLTCTFLHAGLLHIGCNMFSLYVLGSFVEQQWGRWRFLIIYFVAGWAGSCLGVQFAHFLVGASGAVCGMLGAVGAWFVLYRKHIPREVASRGLWSVAINVGLIAFMGFMIPNVSNAGHLGGGIGGAAAALVLHVQRFGLPGMQRKAAMRWLIAGPLLVLLPVASYLQMQRPWGKGDAADRKAERSGKRGSRKIEKPDPVEGAAFYKEFGEVIKTQIYSAHDHVSRTPADAKDQKRVARFAERLKEERKGLTALKGRLEGTSYKDAGTEQLREDAIELIDDLLELLEATDEHLKDPTAASMKKVDRKFNDFVVPYNAYVDRLDEVAPDKGKD